MTGRTALAVLLGTGGGLGLLVLLTAWSPTGPRAGQNDYATGELALPGNPAGPLPRVDRARLVRLGAAVGVGLLVLVVTRWVAAGLGAGALVGCWSSVFGGTGRARDAIARLEALAGWAEGLRDLVATGIALPEALPASAHSAAPALQPALGRMVEQTRARQPLEQVLRDLGDTLDDGGADLVVAALLLNARAQGRALESVLTALAASLRGELRVRQTIAAERRSTRRAVQIVVVVTLLTALGLCLGNPAYVAPYRTTAGQLMLGVVTAVFATGFLWLARLSALPATPRLLPTQSAGTPPPRSGPRPRSAAPGALMPLTTADSSQRSGLGSGQRSGVRR